MAWKDTLKHRLAPLNSREKGIPVSIKIRACGGCYGDCCCPAAHRMIDDAVHQQRLTDEFEIEKHESGPEVLVACALATAGITLATGVVNLVTAIINARTAGQKKGDRQYEPIELIVRGFDKDGKMFEEKVLKIPSGDKATRQSVQKLLKNGIEKHLSTVQKKKKAVAPRNKAKRK